MEWGGNDTLQGFGGDDYLEGGAGQDILNGDVDNDMLVGGEGMDAYIINSGDGHDTIVDSGQNFLMINGEMFTGEFSLNEATGNYEYTKGDVTYTLSFGEQGAHLTLDDTTSLTFQNQTAPEDFSTDNFGFVHFAVLSRSDFAAPVYSGTPLETGGPELSERKQRQLQLAARIEQAAFHSRRQKISAPVDGFVSRLLIHTVGGVVTPAEKLAYLVPDDSPLLIKASLLNRDAGFVTESLPASIKIDTFSFQKYGTIDGHVVQVSKDSIEDEQKGLVYEIYIEPERSSLLVDGVEAPISAGMSVTAEVKVGKRRIIEFFLYPLIKYLDEGISVR